MKWLERKEAAAPAGPDIRRTGPGGMRRPAAFLMAAALLTASIPAWPVRVQAEEAVLVISTVEEFLEFGRACTSERYSEGKTVRLEADLDLAGSGFEPVPVFCGTFEGNGHTISGMSILQSGSSLGLFRYLSEGALVQDLKVEGELRPEGSRKKLGGIAGTNRGTIRGCSFAGTGEALENLGGIAGINEETGIIEACVNQAELTGNRRVGGIAGENAGTIRDCSNEGEINTASEGVDEDSESRTTLSLTPEAIDTMEAPLVIEKVYDVGGIAGLSSGTIRQSRNSGRIGYERTGYNIGGIAGRQSGILVLCENEGQVTGRKDVGGIAGQLEPWLLIRYGKDTFDRIHDQVDEISDTTDAMGQQLRDTTDASVGNLDRVDEIVKLIRDLTRDKKSERRIKREDYDEKAGRQLDLIDEILANTELDLGSRNAQRAAGSLRGNIARARELLEQLQGGAGGEIPLPEDFIFDEDAGALGELQYIYELLKALQECAGNITEDTAAMIDYGVEGVVDGVRDFEDDLDSLRVASKEFLDLTRDYKDQLVEDIDGLDEDVTGQLDQLYDELDALSDNLKSGRDRLREEKDQLDVQLDEMQDILTEGKDRAQSELDRLKNNEEPLFEDVSETATDLNNGMIIGCANKGDIFSDFQAGGVVGTIGIEVDLDPEEDIETHGDESLYRDRYAMASVRECHNVGDIQAQQDYAGGIAGAARIGVLASNQNYGDVCTVDGDYAGGIAGSSQSLISGSYTMCEVSGNDYAGGIAGWGKNLRDNYAMVSVVSGDGEWQGSIAGGKDEEGEASANLYVDDGMGAIDGITFRGEAEGITYESLLQKEDLPSEFCSLTVTFLADDQAVKQLVCQYGQSLDPADMPEIPQKEGFFEYWEETDLSSIRRNYKVHAVYVPWTRTIASSEDPMPALLAEAAFYPETRLMLQESGGSASGQPEAVIPSGSRVVKSIAYTIQPPEGAALPETVTLHVLAEGARRVGILKDGTVETAEAVQDGRYLVFTAAPSGELVLMKNSLPWAYILAAAVIVMAVVGKVAAGKKGKRE